MNIKSLFKFLAGILFILSACSSPSQNNVPIQIESPKLVEEDNNFRIKADNDYFEPNVRIEKGTVPFTYDPDLKKVVTDVKVLDGNNNNIIYLAKVYSPKKGYSIREGIDFALKPKKKSLINIYNASCYDVTFLKDKNQYAVSYLNSNDNSVYLQFYSNNSGKEKTPIGSPIKVSNNIGNLIGDVCYAGLKIESFDKGIVLSYPSYINTRSGNTPIISVHLFNNNGTPLLDWQGKQIPVLVSGSHGKDSYNSFRLHDYKLKIYKHDNSMTMIDLVYNVVDINAYRERKFMGVFSSSWILQTINNGVRVITEWQDQDLKNRFGLTQQGWNPDIVRNKSGVYVGFLNLNSSNQFQVSLYRIHGAGNTSEEAIITSNLITEVSNKQNFEHQINLISGNNDEIHISVERTFYTYKTNPSNKGYLSGGFKTVGYSIDNGINKISYIADKVNNILYWAYIGWDKFANYTPYLTKVSLDKLEPLNIGNISPNERYDNGIDPVLSIALKSNKNGIPEKIEATSNTRLLQTADLFVTDSSGKVVFESKGYDVSGANQLFTINNEIQNALKSGSYSLYIQDSFGNTRSNSLSFTVTEPAVFHSSAPVLATKTNNPVLATKANNLVLHQLSVNTLSMNIPVSDVVINKIFKATKYYRKYKIDKKNGRFYKIFVRKQGIQGDLSVTHHFDSNATTNFITGNIEFENKNDELKTIQFNSSNDSPYYVNVYNDSLTANLTFTIRVEEGAYYTPPAPRKQILVTGGIWEKYKEFSTNKTNPFDKNTLGNPVSDREIINIQLTNTEIQIQDFDKGRIVFDKLTNTSTVYPIKNEYQFSKGAEQDYVNFIDECKNEYSVLRVVTKTGQDVYMFLVGDSIETLLSTDSSFIEKAIASVDLATTSVGGAFIKVTAKVTWKVGTKVVAFTASKVVSKSAFNSLKYAKNFGISSYSKLKKAVRDSGLPTTEKIAKERGWDHWVEVHHIPDERFSKIGTWNQKSGDMMSIVLTKEEHDVFTTAFQKIIGKDGDKITRVTTSTATKKDILDAIREVYKDYPEILEALKINL